MAVGCSVSVLVPAYNSAPTLARAVQSALRQELQQIEVLIIDDGSRDSTNDVAAGLCREDPRVRLITLAQNHGKPYAMNVGAAQANGEWLAVLDADDWYAPDRFSTLLSAAEQHQADLVADNQFVYDAGASRVVRTAFPSAPQGRLLDKAAFVAGSDPYADFDYGMLKPVVRTEFVRAHGLAYRETARLSEDFLYLLEFFAAGGRGWLVTEPMYYWSQAFGTISRRWTETGSGRWRYDYLSAIKANAEVLQTMYRAGDEQLASLLRRRIRAFRQLHSIQRVSRMRAEGASPLRVVGEVLGHPSVWPLIARRGIRRVTRSLPLQSPMRA